MQRRSTRRGGTARVDHDQAAPCRFLIGQPAHEGRHRLGGIAAGQQDHVRLREIFQRERQPAVDAERAVAGGGRGRHAEPAVVVDVRRAERDAGKFAEQVRLFVGEPAAAEDRDPVGAIAAPDLPEARSHQVEGLVPAGWAQRFVTG